MADRPADRAGNAKSVRRSPRLLAGVAVRCSFACPLSTVTLTLCALAVAGAVAMFLELEQGFGGLVRISPEPMRKAVKTLEAKPSNQNAP